jgi:hypothetical protein
MRKIIILLFVLGFILGGAPSVLATTITGSVFSQSGGSTSTGSWIENTTMFFSVTDPDQNPTDYWYYEYTFSPNDSPSIQGGGISHITIEVSDNFTAANIFDISGSYELSTGKPEQDFLAAIPGDMAGTLKFAGTGSSDPFTFWLYSDRAPMWGDFLAKDGVNTWAWNTGIGDSRPTTAWDVDLEDQPAGFILVPDTQSTPIPEPATVLLLGSGLLGLIGYSRKKLKS